MSASQVAMRQMKSLNDLVVSSYMVVSYLLVFLPICIIFDYDLTIWRQFDLTDWGCIVFISVAMVVMQTVRFMAIARHPLSGLQPFTFLVPLQQMVTDFALFNQEFTIV